MKLDQVKRLKELEILGHAAAQLALPKIRQSGLEAAWPKCKTVCVSSWTTNGGWVRSL